MDFKIRESRKEQGARKLSREGEEYFRLVKLGFSNNEASRRVGVHPRTGREWRNGRPAGGKKRPRPPAIVGVASGTSRYLTENERLHIADRLQEKATVRAIAAELGRSPSTISREIRRNGIPVRAATSCWAYRPHAAQRRADQRRPRPKPGKIGQNPELRDFIQHRLERRWSPEQICQALGRRFPTGRRCTWSTRRSTRPSTFRGAENSAAS